jgi:ABC-type nickel/cobalt efflux system permease component RcnA
MPRLACLAALLVLLAGLAAPVAAIAQSSTSSGGETQAPAADSAPRASKSMVAGRDTATTARRRGDGAFDGIMLWIEARQRELNRALTGSVRELKSQGSLQAALVLAGIGFLYGVLHAAGPGHGKAIVTSYVLADGRTLRRGIAVAFMAAFVQALSAIVLVGLLAIILGATGQAIQAASNRLEQASYILVALIGAWLLWRTVRDAMRAAPADARGHDHRHAHGHAHHHAHAHHAHGPDEACVHCGHVHLPAPGELQGAWSWRRAATLAAAVGIRPCTGAIIVLVFALSQGLLWAGIWATFAMALGTAITVSVLAAMTVGARGLAVQMTSGSGTWAGRIETAAGIAGASLLLLLGVLFFLASLGASRPF